MNNEIYVVRNRKTIRKKKKPQPGGYALLSNLSQNICKSEDIWEGLERRDIYVGILCCKVYYSSD